MGWPFEFAVEFIGDIVPRRSWTVERLWRWEGDGGANAHENVVVVPTSVGEVVLVLNSREDVGKFDVSRTTQRGGRAEGGARAFDSSDVPAHQDGTDCWIDQFRVASVFDVDDGTLLVGVAEIRWNRGGLTDEERYRAPGADARLVGVCTIR